MELVDTHCHIHEATRSTGYVYDKWQRADKKDPHQLAEAASQAGVARLICVGCTLRDSHLAVDVAAAEPSCWASVGIHPHEATAHRTAAVLAELTALAATQRVVAIGECGLDYFYTHSPKSDQITVLEYQLQLALDRDLPVIFHVRAAFDDFWPIYDNFPGLRGVLHSFTDNQKNLERALSRDLYIGVNGIATFTKDPEQRAMFQHIPLQKLLLETDAPFLTPVPVRGTINEPKNVMYITKFLAELRGEPDALVAQATTHNAVTLFGLE